MKEWTAKFRQLQTMPRVVKSVNPEYQTAHFGKWHLKYGPVLPEELGYDFSDDYTDNGQGDALENEGDPVVDKYIPEARKDPKKVFDITNRACDFMEKTSSNGKPFLVQLSHYAVHLKVAYSQESLDRTKTRPLGVKQTFPPYAAMTEDVDASIKILWDRLEKA